MIGVVLFQQPGLLHGPCTARLCLLLALASCFGLAFASSGNLALSARFTASSSRPDYPLTQVNDGDMSTSWSTANGQVKNQWLRMDWDGPRNLCGAALYSTGPWTQTIEAQVLEDGKWVTVGPSGSAAVKAPPVSVFSFAPVETRSMRFLFEGGAAFYEVEAYDDPAQARRVLEEEVLPRIVVSSDLRGHLVGTVSRDAGSTALAGAKVSVWGNGPGGSWAGKATADANGWFVADLPFGSTGPVHIAAGSGIAASPKVPVDAAVSIDAEAVVDASDLATVLTPKQEGGRLSLDGTWDWAAIPADWDPDKCLTPSLLSKSERGGGAALHWSKVKVPAHWEMEGLTTESGKAVYERHCAVPAAWAGKRIKLRADAVYSRCQVCVNGKRVGGHEGGATPFELDVTDAAAPGRTNEILIQVDARSPASNLDNASYFASYELAGIWQHIELFAVPAVHVSHLAVNTHFDDAYRDASLDVEADLVREEAGSAGSHELSFKLYDPSGHALAVPSLTKTVVLGPWSRTVCELTARVEKPVQWNAEDPKLYRLVALIDGKRVLEQPVGFRQIEVKDRRVLLNGVPLKIRGISRLECHPLVGRALTDEMCRLDTEMIKSANFNAVRATIFPPHAAMLDEADTTGLYYENEGPTCWGDHADDLRYVPVYAGIMCQYLERDRNHPCVFDWSICNESSFGRVFSITHDLMKSLDPTRLYSASWGDDTLDVDVYHHPVSVERIKESSTSPRPAFFDECLGLFHGWQDLALWLDLDPGMKDYWVEGIADILRAINAGRNQLGTMQFSWCDDTALVPGKGIDVYRRGQPPIRFSETTYKMPKRGMVGDVVWGTVDGWRRPRPEYWLSQKLYSPVQIEERPLALPVSGPVVVPVENFNQFVDLNRYTCRWSIGAEKGEARAQCKPMSSGELQVPVSKPPRSEDVLSLEFSDWTGRLVDAYRLTFQAHPIPALASSGKPARIVTRGAYLDRAAPIRLMGGDCELAYDQVGGELYRCLKNGEVVLNAGPTLRLLKTTAPTEVYPIGNGLTRGAFGNDADWDMYETARPSGGTVPLTAWHLTGADARVEGRQAVLDWKGAYGKDLVGGFEIRMDDAGDVEIRYEFKYQGPPISVREVALEFALPTSCDRLEWDRRAEYSVYPPDHIGRPHGMAVAHPAAVQSVPPGSRPWALDDHPWGCNDFRSTKRNVYWATLTDSAGTGVKVISNGTQHVRATADTHDVLLKVMDWYGGEGWTYAGGFHYGDGKHIATGEVLKGVVRLQLLGGK